MVMLPTAPTLHAVRTPPQVYLLGVREAGEQEQGHVVGDRAGAAAWAVHRDLVVDHDGERVAVALDTVYRYRVARPEHAQTPRLGLDEFARCVHG
jgi:hypothetical protein